MTHVRRSLIALLMLAGMVHVPISLAQAGVPCAPGEAPIFASPAATTDAGWTEHAPMPRPRSELGAVAIGTTIYVVGGFGGPSMLDCYDTATDSWSTGADLPQGVHHPGVAALGGKVYVAGGYTENGASDAVWAYNPATDAWTARAPLPQRRGALGLAALDGKLYAIGGATERLGGPVTGAVDVYDPDTDSWEPASSMPTPREHLAVVAADGRIFAIGGRANGDEGGQFASAVEAYVPDTDSWETVSELPTPRGGFAGAFVSGRVVVLGGERGDTTFSAVEAYDPITNEWTSLPDMPTARHGVGVTAIGDTIYAIGGSTVAGTVENTGAVETLDSPEFGDE